MMYKKFFVLFGIALFSIIPSLLSANETLTYHYDSSGRFKDVVGADDFTILKHDAAGNLTSRRHWNKNTTLNGPLDLQAIKLSDAIYLTTLTLDGTGYSNFSEIDTLTSLNSLDVSGTNMTLTEIQARLTSLTGLTVFDMSGIAFSDANAISFLQNAPNLERVFVQSNTYVNTHCYDFSFWLGTPPPVFMDSDMDGADNCTEYTTGTNMWHANSAPLFAERLRVAGQNDFIEVDMSAAFAALSGVGDLKRGWHPVWSDLDGDGDLDVAVYIHGKYEIDTDEELTCVIDCSYGYSGRLEGKLLIYENVNNIFTEKTVTGSTEPRSDINDFYVYDYDNDGDRDLLLITYYDMELYRNDGNMSFVNNTANVFDDNSAVAETNLLDANMDGYVDLLLTSYGGAVLYQYDTGLNKYVDVTTGSGLTTAGTLLYQNTTLLDVNQDGVLDVVTHRQSDSLHPIHVYTGDGDGTFQHTSLAASHFPGVTTTENFPLHTRVTDYNHDGKPDIIWYEQRIIDNGANILNLDYAGSEIRLLTNTTDLTASPVVPSFSEDTLASGLIDPGSTVDHPLGGTLIDFDNDRDIDLMKAERNSLRKHLHEQISNDAFVLLDDRMINLRYGNKHPIIADYDLDGRVDILMPRLSQSRAQIYYNTNANGNQGITLKLIGNDAIPHLATNYTSSLDAVGARVTVDDGTTTHTQQVLPTFGQDAQLYFGVGTASTVDVTVDWPSGRNSQHTVTVGPGLIQITEP